MTASRTGAQSASIAFTILVSFGSVLLAPTTAFADEVQAYGDAKAEISQCQYLIARGIRNSGDCSHYVTQQPSEKDVKDCIEQGGIWGGFNIKGGPRAAASNAAAGCISAVVSNHSH
jgi:hypothetical protein